MLPFLNEECKYLMCFKNGSFLVKIYDLEINLGMFEHDEMGIFVDD